MKHMSYKREFVVSQWFCTSLSLPLSFNNDINFNQWNDSYKLLSWVLVGQNTKKKYNYSCRWFVNHTACSSKLRIKTLIFALHLLQLHAFHTEYFYLRMFMNYHTGKLHYIWRQRNSEHFPHNQTQLHVSLDWKKFLTMYYMKKATQLTNNYKTVCLTCDSLGSE
jgi:hypothetical protein